jgi:hypothetical protein
MCKSQIVMLSGAVLIALLTPTTILRLHAEEKNETVGSAEVATAAREAYDVYETEYRAFRCVVGEVYDWSIRVMEAERAEGKTANAVKDHLDRMLAIHTFAEQIYKKNQGLRGVPDYYATRYYLLEARAMLAKAARDDK